MDINTITLAGKDASLFEISADGLSGTSLQPMSTGSLTVEYKPGQDPGPHAASIILQHSLSSDTIFLESKRLVQPVYRSIIDPCDESTGWSSSNTFGLNNRDHREGGACLESSGMETNEFRKSFTTPVRNIALKKNAWLQMWYYVSDISKFDPRNQLEIGSGGNNDIDEFNWNLDGRLQNGWNLLNLKFSEAGTNGNPDINSINWVRVYHWKTGDITTRIDNIQIIDSTITAPTQATEPVPADQASDQQDVNLLDWTPGTGTDSTHVYFDTVSPPEFLKTITSSSYRFPEYLAPGKTYYWRVDGINAVGKTRGETWSFSTANEPTGISITSQDKPTIFPVPAPSSLRTSALIALALQSSPV